MKLLSCPPPGARRGVSYAQLCRNEGSVLHMRALDVNLVMVQFDTGRGLRVERSWCGTITSFEDCVGQQRSLLPSPVACVSDTYASVEQQGEVQLNTADRQPQQTTINQHAVVGARVGLSLRRSSPLLARTCHTSSVPDTVLSAALWWWMMECSSLAPLFPPCAGHN